MKRTGFSGRYIRCAGILLSGMAALSFCAVGLAAEADPQESAGFASLGAMETDELETARGREGVQFELVNVQSIQDMEATTSGSSFRVRNGDMVTGDITFESGAMGHYSGTGIFNNVTGNANAVNNAIGISIYINSP